ncbi:MAG TPA: arsenite methyltransferase [Thermoanaerobaculia bacterium]|nr:arsenite methyltransferase [Thermoanaerobaculia bacterium]
MSLETKATPSPATGCCGSSVSTASTIKEAVQQKYGEAARSVLTTKASCCGSVSDDPITSDLYDDAEKGALPETAVRASLGCGNPTALASLSPGETVLDLGSGGGIDVILSARRVGPAGKAYGLDMTDEMLELARQNQRKAGVENVEFLKGEIESIPLPDNSVDVVISNCVINLSADKGRVLREAFRVLRPGGRFAVSDIVRRRPVPEAIRRNLELWAGCVAGALEETEYIDLLRKAGFANVAIEVTREYHLAEAQAFLEEAGIDVETIPSDVDGAWISGFVRATKPV